MGQHIPRDPRRKKVKEHDELARRRRTSFKQYLRDIEEEMLEEELATADEDNSTQQPNLDD